MMKAKKLLTLVLSVAMLLTLSLSKPIYAANTWTNCDACGAAMTRVAYVGTCNLTTCNSAAYFYKCPNSETHTHRAVCTSQHVQ